MRVKGKITEWNDLRGFGFISPLKGSERVFVHISAFPTETRRPTAGEFISYSLGNDQRGRVCATEVAYAVSHVRRPAARMQTRHTDLVARCVAATFLGAVVLLTVFGYLGWPVPCACIVMSIATFFAYKHDKQAAQLGAWRTEEWTLIALGLIGGWPGALIARHRFRHKTKKFAFRIAYWLSVGLNIAGLAWLIAP